MPPKRSRSDGRLPRRRLPGAARLAACLAVAAAAWLAVLPRVGRLPAVRAMIQRNEALGIDPAAKFYTELPAMPRILEQLRDMRRPTAPPEPLAPRKPADSP
ncbi:MAG TPA: hypothetical protein PJ982_08695 [Lacipirellulaceae bacterium]|nr:hypothetical protein [Lacipirellulaceae bacterium]